MCSAVQQHGFEPLVPPTQLSCVLGHMPPLQKLAGSAEYGHFPCMMMLGGALALVVSQKQHTLHRIWEFGSDSRISTLCMKCEKTVLSSHFHRLTSCTCEPTWGPSGNQHTQPIAQPDDPGCRTSVSSHARFSSTHLPRARPLPAVFPQIKTALMTWLQRDCNTSMALLPPFLRNKIAQTLVRVLQVSCLSGCNKCMFV